MYFSTRMYKIHMLLQSYEKKSRNANVFQDIYIKKIFCHNNLPNPPTFNFFHEMQNFGFRVQKFP